MIEKIDSTKNINSTKIQAPTFKIYAENEFFDVAKVIDRFVDQNCCVQQRLPDWNDYFDRTDLPDKDRGNLSPLSLANVLKKDFKEGYFSNGKDVIFYVCAYENVRPGVVGKYYLASLHKSGLTKIYCSISRSIVHKMIDVEDTFSEELYYPKNANLIIENGFELFVNNRIEKIVEICMNAQNVFKDMIVKSMTFRVEYLDFLNKIIESDYSPVIKSFGLVGLLSNLSQYVPLSEKKRLYELRANSENDDYLVGIKNHTIKLFLTPLFGAYLPDQIGRGLFGVYLPDQIGGGNENNISWEKMNYIVSLLNEDDYEKTYFKDVSIKRQDKINKCILEKEQDYNIFNRTTCYPTKEWTSKVVYSYLACPDFLRLNKKEEEQLSLLQFLNYYYFIEDIEQSLQIEYFQNNVNFIKDFKEFIKEKTQSISSFKVNHDSLYLLFDDEKKKIDLWIEEFSHNNSYHNSNGDEYLPSMSREYYIDTALFKYSSLFSPCLQMIFSKYFSNDKEGFDIFLQDFMKIFKRKRDNVYSSHSYSHYFSDLDDKDALRETFEDFICDSRFYDVLVEYLNDQSIPLSMLLDINNLDF